MCLINLATRDNFFFFRYKELYLNQRIQYYNQVYKDTLFIYTFKFFFLENYIKIFISVFVTCSFSQEIVFFTAIYLTYLAYFIFFRIFLYFQYRIESRSDACDVESCLGKIYVYLCYYLSFSRSCRFALARREYWKIKYLLIKIAVYRVQSVSNVINS